MALAKFIYPHNSFVPQFAFLLLKSDFFQARLTGATRSAQAGFNKGDLADITFPLPPLAEQQRIVAKADELMALCDRLEAAQAEREYRRDRLVVSSLNRLNNGADPDAFREHAHFYFNHLPRLTTKPEHIQQLRQTILNFAVRGKLVPQDPHDEPASQLLRNIDEVKRQLVKGKKSKTPAAGCSVDHRATPYELPATWEWVRLDELCQFENGDRSHNYPSGSDIKNDGVPFISTKNIFQHKVRLENLDFITEEKFKSLRSGKLMDCDILIVLRGSVGKLGLFEASDRYKTGFINAQLLILRNYHPKVVDYCLTYLMSQLFQDLAFEQSSGSAQPQLSAGNLSSVLVPLPPLAEQQRIVAKVDELMALCDKLEAQLTTTQSESRRLIEAVLHKALAPAV